MTFHEACKAAQGGKSVSHPSANGGWHLKFDGKSAVWVHPVLKHSAPVDKLDQHRKDWAAL